MSIQTALKLPPQCSIEVNLYLVRSFVSCILVIIIIIISYHRRYRQRCYRLFIYQLKMMTIDWRDDAPFHKSNVYDTGVFLALTYRTSLFGERSNTRKRRRECDHYCDGRRNVLTSNDDRETTYAPLSNTWRDDARLSTTATSTTTISSSSQE